MLDEVNSRKEVSSVTKKSSPDTIFTFSSFFLQEAKGKLIERDWLTDGQERKKSEEEEKGDNNNRRQLILLGTIFHKKSYKTVWCSFTAVKKLYMK